MARSRRGPRLQRLLELVCLGYPQATAAQAAMVPGRTATRWIREHRERLHAMQLEAAEAGRGILHATVAKAAHRLAVLIDSADENVALGACRASIAAVTRMAELDLQAQAQGNREELELDLARVRAELAAGLGLVAPAQIAPAAPSLAGIAPQALAPAQTQPQTAEATPLEPAAPATPADTAHAIPSPECSACSTQADTAGQLSAGEQAGEQAPGRPAGPPWEGGTETCGT